MRGKQAPKREQVPDPKYNSTVISKLINMIMQRGKKTVAQGIVYDAFEIIKAKTKQKPMDVFELAIKNISPLLEVKARRIGGANYQVPVEVKGDRRLTLALRWLIGSAQSRKGMPMRQRMAESNRAFAHFA